MESITLNGKKFSAQNLAEIHTFAGDGLSQETTGEIVQFLREWWNDADDIGVHTSGSTGSPKPIRLAKSVVASSADLTIAFFGLDHSMTGLLCLPCRYIAGKLMLIRAIRSGMALEVREPAMDVLSENLPEIHFAALIPAQVHQALQHKNATNRLAAIPKVLIGGGPLDRDTENQLKPLPNRFYHSYGMTETATHVALRDISDGAEEYAALPGVSFALDTRGCLIISAHHLPEKIITNDLVELSGSQHFKWLGRYDHAIISGGLKFIPEELERKMAPFISQNFYLTGRPHPQLGQQLELVLEGTPWPDEKFEALRKRLAEVLNPYETPKSVRFVTQFERTETGKVFRR